MQLHRWTQLILILGGIFYSYSIDADIPSVEKGYFSISSLKTHQSPFEKTLLYKGELYAKGRKVPCTTHSSYSQEHPKANVDYILLGKLNKRGPYNYTFKAEEWIPVEKTWKAAELRFQLKERFKQFLNQKLKHPKTASLLGSLITGDVEDRSLRYEFGRLGLQHILAISGFHFAILISFCSFFLSLFLNNKWKNIALIFLINSYFLFVGAVPAVQRSWLTALFYLTGKLIGRHSSGLNLLGVSLLIEVLFDPLVSAQIGFQLSFLSCAGILLFEPLFKPWTKALFPAHDPFKLSRLDQHGYLLASFLRGALTLALSVNGALLPLILYHFHSFPLLSFVYNLFFPLLLSSALFMLLLSLVCYLLFPPLAILLFQMTDFMTLQLLDIVSYPPLPLDYALRTDSLPAWIIPPYIFTLFCLSIAKNRFFLTNTPASSNI